MIFMDVIKLAATILISLGGGGAIVFGLSTFLGKLWADRALEDHRHKYAQLSQQMQHDLDMVSRRVQVELDALALIHNLRTTEEFSRVAALWKRFAILLPAFRAISGPREYMGPSYQEDWQKYQDKRYASFEAAAHDAEQFYYEEMIFIPEGIAEQAGLTLGFALGIVEFLDNREDVPLRIEFSDMVQMSLRSFVSSSNDLHRLIRKYVRGELGEDPSRPPGERVEDGKDDEGDWHQNA
jgi:hypothetical protein